MVFVSNSGKAPLLYAGIISSLSFAKMFFLEMVVCCSITVMESKFVLSFIFIIPSVCF